MKTELAQEIGKTVEYDSLHSSVTDLRSSNLHLEETIQELEQQLTAANVNKLYYSLLIRKGKRCY